MSGRGWSIPDQTRMKIEEGDNNTSTNLDNIVHVSELVLDGGLVNVVHPVLVHNKLVLVLAHRQVDQRHKVLLRFHHRDPLPVREGATDKHLLSIARILKKIPTF